MSSVIKKWLLVLSAFLAGLLISGIIGGIIDWRLVRVIRLYTDLIPASEARMALFGLKSIDQGTTNSLAQFQLFARSNLSQFVHDVDQQKTNGHEPNPLILPTYQEAREYLYPFTFAEKKEADFFWGKMIPLAQEFIRRNNLPDDSHFGTNDIRHYRVNFHQDRPGCSATLQLDNGYNFMFSSDGQNAEVWGFSDGSKTDYDLAGAPQDEIVAVKALSLRNKLNDQSALALAENFFKLQGHRDDDFHPVFFHQLCWGKKGDPDYVPFPFYLAQWYRKDVNLADAEKGIVTLPSVMIEISGIDRRLIIYTKVNMPIGRDF
jgi:hypothetical protein